MSATASRANSPNRRALSLTLDEAIGAINRHSENLDYLKTQQDTLKTQLDTLTERVKMLDMAVAYDVIADERRCQGDHSSRKQIVGLQERLDTDVPLQIAASTATLRRGFWGRLTWIARGR